MAQRHRAGDAFTVTAGCDKHFATCQAKFANAVNFRGFPHMPGNDFVTAVARPAIPPTTALSQLTLSSRMAAQGSPGSRQPALRWSLSAPAHPYLADRMSG
jgi:hypothetical protein